MREANGSSRIHIINEHFPTKTYKSLEARKHQKQKSLKKRYALIISRVIFPRYISESRGARTSFIGSWVRHASSAKMREPRDEEGTWADMKGNSTITWAIRAVLLSNRTRNSDKTILHVSLTIAVNSTSFFSHLLGSSLMMFSFHQLINVGWEH